MPLGNKDPAPREDAVVAWPDVVKFTRQLAHDVRNGLNGLDLEAAFVAELNTNPEIAEELKKLRAMVVNITRNLHEVSSYMGSFAMNTIDLEASILLKELRDRLAKRHPEEMAGVAWTDAACEEIVQVDVERFAEVLRELFKNAFQFHKAGEPLSFTSACEEGRLVLELREGKSAPLAPEEWGAPLLSTRRGGYGLGLFHAKRVLEAHQGELKQVYDPTKAALVTRVSLPLKT